MTKEEADKLCNCDECGRRDCKYRYKNQRLSREYAYGGLSLCPRLKEEAGRSHKS